jgi:hypothetical protein
MWRLGAGAQRASDAAQPCDQPGPGRVDGRTKSKTDRAGECGRASEQCVSGTMQTLFHKLKTLFFDHGADSFAQ